MRMTKEGVALIKEFEGFRAEAYRDAVGVWTIGYGHTSMAGEPRVVKGLRVTEREAEAILWRDINRVAREVSGSLRTGVSDHQFSALVSFCFNVGSVNFRKSSVLEAVNRSDWHAVPRRLALWTKAGGKVLPGLVRRRAAEAALFVGDEVAISVRPDAAVTGKEPQSSTSIAAAVIAALLAALQPVFGDASSVATVLLLLLIAAAMAWIIRERLNKIYKDGL